MISLNPSVMRTSTFPVGWPILMLKGEDTCRPYISQLPQLHGIIMCTVLPCENAIIPVLGYRCCGRLMFPLCRTCAENLSVNACTHNDTQRALFGTYTIVEITFAVQRRYVVLNVFELWIYSVTQHKLDGSEDGLFT